MNMGLFVCRCVWVFIIVLVKATEFRFDKKSSTSWVFFFSPLRVFTIFAFVLTIFF